MQQDVAAVMAVDNKTRKEFGGTKQRAVLIDLAVLDLQSMMSLGSHSLDDAGELNGDQVEQIRG